MKQLLYKYRHGIALIYLPLYLLAFFTLESIVTTEFYAIESVLDSYIPFCEAFIIPYYLWFAYIALTFLYFFFTNRRDFFRLCLFMFTGMTLCLIIYAIWPNGHYLRPDLDALGRDNLFIDALRGLYTADTSTNVCPSIHTLNSIGACIAIFHTDSFKEKKWLRWSAFALTVAICISTVCLKQHSIIDVFCGMLLAVPLYFLAYRPKYERISEQL